MLTSFIAAHQHAQNKIHEFLVLDDDQAASPGIGSDESRSPEERKVISESEEAVLAASRLLEEMNKESVAQIRSKQVIALVLTKEAELVKNMVSEGLLTAKVNLLVQVLCLTITLSLMLFLTISLSLMLCLTITLSLMLFLTITLSLMLCLTTTLSLLLCPPSC